MKVEQLGAAMRKIAEMKDRTTIEQLRTALQAARDELASKPQNHDIMRQIDDALDAARTFRFSIPDRLEEIANYYDALAGARTDRASPASGATGDATCRKAAEIVRSVWPTLDSMFFEAAMKENND